jgi:hypothetical protein
MGRLITVLGMHRSGTSAVAGLMADHGVAFGWMRESNAFNPRGNRENRELRWLHDAVLERNGGSWFEPPDSIRLEPADREKRDAELAGFEGDVLAVKDPRLLLLTELWRDLEPSSIGVIRNPVAVRESLERRSLRKRPAQKRARQHRNPVLEPSEWEELWCSYNRRLLSELEREPFPLVDFDRAEALDDQVRDALVTLGVSAPGTSTFYDPELATEVDMGWRERALTSESVELWEGLSEYTRP